MAVKDSFFQKPGLAGEEKGEHALSVDWRRKAEK
jgi:hypothetical protein